MSRKELVPGGGCASEPTARQGPYYSPTRAVGGGRTPSRFLTRQQAETARRLSEAGREFRQQVDAYWELFEQWADQQLERTGAACAEAVEKGAFGGLLIKPRSPQKSPYSSAGKPSRRPI